MVLGNGDDEELAEKQHVTTEFVRRDVGLSGSSAKSDTDTSGVRTPYRFTSREPPISRVICARPNIPMACSMRADASVPPSPP